MTQSKAATLDPVTLEVLKNRFVTIVDQMAEQILRTCHSLVMFSRDFSCSLCDRDGNTVAQGSQDLACHVGTMHFTAKAVIEAFEEIRPGDVFLINDPYLGGTHNSDVRVIRPIFADQELIGFAQSNGHWVDVGGSVPGSFDATQRDYFALGLRIPPLKVWDQGVLRQDVLDLLLTNMRAPDISLGDLHAQAEATRVAENEVMALVDRYGGQTIVDAFEAVQDYVEDLTRKRLSALPDGEWETEDYLDLDPDKEEGLVRVRVKMVIDGDRVSYDLSGSDPAIGTLSNCTFGSAFSGIISGTKLFFPDIPLNSGFYRAVDFDAGPEGSVVNAAAPLAVSGNVMAYEKVADCVIEMWSGIVRERALACAFQIEYLQLAGLDMRRPDHPGMYVFYDWLSGGWGGRNGRDGPNVTSAVFGPGLNVQSVEAQERIAPVLTTRYDIVRDSGGPGRHRGGCGVVKGGRLDAVAGSVLSYICDRERSIVWGLEGGLCSSPHGLWIERENQEPEFLGALFSNESLAAGDAFWRASAGGGGFGDPLLRDSAAVVEDILDDYVSIHRAERDYGVVVERRDGGLVVDEAATDVARAEIRASRSGWLREDPVSVAARFRAGELDALDLIRRYGVIVHWGTGELYERTTEQFRHMLERRVEPGWAR